MAFRRHRRRPHIGICHYHLCQRRTEVYRCRYCGNFFCKEHIRPKPAGVPHFGSTSKEDQLFIEEYHKPDGHPCMPYLEHWKAKKKKEEEGYNRTLDWLIKSEPSPSEESEKKREQEEYRQVLDKEVKSFLREEKERRNREFRQSYQGEEEAEKNRLKVWACVAIFIGLLAFLVYILLNPTQSVTCANGLKSETCSPEKPIYCANGTLINRADLCGCLPNFRAYNSTDCIKEVTCYDGTFAPDCSQNKPYQCVNGTLIENATLCGCPENYRNKNDTCVLIQNCSDGTFYDDCSATKPFYCANGTLVKKPLDCGCPDGFIPYGGDDCIEAYKVGAKNRTLYYTLNGSTHAFNITVYAGLNGIVASETRTFICINNVCPSQEEMYVMDADRKINEEPQEKELKSLADTIRGFTSNTDDQVRIAISIVQHIPYDDASVSSDSLKGRYPYQVLYDNMGVCGEKSPLLAALLKELGYGVVLLNFEQELHEAVGIKCPIQYSFRNSGYCFVESTMPSIITDDQENYTVVGKLFSEPQTILVSNGTSFDSVKTEYDDAKLYESLIAKSAKGNGYLDEHSYNQWKSLIEKYDMKAG